MTPFTLAAVVTSRDNASPAISKITSHFESLKGAIKSVDPQLEKFSSGMGEITAGAKAMGVGAVGLMLTKSFVNARLEVTQLESDIRSLGRSAEGVEKISLMADKVGVAFGTSREEFLQAGYDIKSGIASLSDTGVAEYTRLVSVTAAATKGSTAQMASYFGSVANIFRSSYKEMNEMDFGKMIANQSAMATQLYKTDAVKLQSAMESVSSAAAATGMKLSEQMAIIGNLSNKMGGGEAGTALRSFVQNAGEAGTKLGLSFTNADGHLKSTADIIDLIKGKYGDLQSAVAQQQIKDAFGTDEAVKLVQNLSADTNKLRGEVTMLTEAGRAFGDTGPAFKMAGQRTDNAAANLQKVDQSWGALKSAMGKGLENAFAPMAESAAKLVGAVAEFLNEHEGITEILGLTLALGGAVVFLYGAYKTIRGMVMLYTLAQGALAIATEGSAVATGTATGAFAGMSAAMSANPIGVIIMAVAALAVGAYYLYKHWDELKERLLHAPVWAKVLVGAILLPLAPIILMIAAIVLIRRHWDDIVAAGNRAAVGMRKVWQMLPEPVRNTLSLLLVMTTGIVGAALTINNEWDKLKDKVGAVTDYIKEKWTAVKSFFGVETASESTTAATAAVDGQAAGEKYAEGLQKSKPKISGAANEISSAISEQFSSIDLGGGQLQEVAYSRGKKFGETYASGIRGSTPKVNSAMEMMTGGMSQYLNQSDAKKGPLSKTTGYGKSFVQTWGKGVVDESSRTPVPEQFAKVQAKTINPDTPLMKKLSGKNQNQDSGGLMVSAKSLANIVINLSGSSLTIEKLSAMLSEAILSELEKSGYGGELC